MIEALFDPQSLPDLLAELAVSDEANRRTMTVQVIQRPGGGIVRGVIASPSGEAQRGATVLNSLRHAETPIDGNTFSRAVRLLAGPRRRKLEPKLLETGIKVFDVLCPLAVGGTVAIAGEFGAGTTVVMEELVRRLSGEADRISLFTLVQRWKEEDFSYGAELKKDGFSEGTVGAVQTFFFRAGDGPWTTERLAELASVDTVIHLDDDFSRTRSTSPPASLAVQAIRLKSLCATASHASGETGSTYGIAVFFSREMSEWPAMPRPTHESQIAGELSSAP